MNDHIRIYTESMSDGTATVVSVEVFTNEFYFHGSGSSKRMPGDYNDPELGRLLALQRALDNVKTSITARTRRIIEVNDKKKREAANWKSKEEWEAEQEAKLRKIAMAAHPAGKTRK